MKHPVSAHSITNGLSKHVSTTHNAIHTLWTIANWPIRYDIKWIDCVFVIQTTAITILYFTIAVDTEDEDDNAVVDTLFRVERAILRHESEHTNLQAWFHRSGKRKWIFLVAIARQFRMQSPVGQQSNQFPIDHVFVVKVRKAKRGRKRATSSNRWIRTKKKEI